MLFSLIAVVVILGVIYFTLYNRLIARKNQVDYAWGGIDALLKKRYDLIPNLVGAVKEYMQHERGVLERLTVLRTQALAKGLPEGERMKLEGELSRALHGFFAVAENYPNLKANENFLQLQGTLNEVEEQISAARRAYNAAVMDWNNAIEMFPTNYLARQFRYVRKEMLQTPSEEQTPIQVSRLFQG